MKNGHSNELIWISDLHIDLLDNRTRQRFLNRLYNKNLPVICTGDYCKGISNKIFFDELFRYVSNDIYFMPGNYDYYESSIEEVDEYLSSLPIKLMNKLSYQVLSRNTVILGSVSWYDPYKISKFNSGINDFLYIRELSEFDGFDKLKEISNIEIETFKKNLYSIPDEYTNIIILSHPVLWKIMNKGWRPELENYFINEKVGLIIEEYSKLNYDKNILVLSGHTHKKSTYRKYNINSYSPQVNIKKPEIIALISTDLEITWMGQSIYLSQFG